MCIFMWIIKTEVKVLKLKLPFVGCLNKIQCVPVQRLSCQKGVTEEKMNKLLWKLWILSD